MSRHSSGVLTAAGSATLPIISLYSIAATGGKLLEVGVFNTTATAVALALKRLTTAGTQGAGLTESSHDPAVVARMTAFTTHSGNPTLGDDLGYRGVLGAVVGASIIFTIAKGIIIPVGTANGIGLIVENGTGQICQAYMVWEE